MNLRSAQRHLAWAFIELNKMIDAGCTDVDTIFTQRLTLQAIKKSIRSSQHFISVKKEDDDDKG